MQMIQMLYFFQPILPKFLVSAETSWQEHRRFEFLGRADTILTICLETENLIEFICDKRFTIDVLIANDFQIISSF